MTEFEFWKMAYKEGWCTKVELDEAVLLGLITQDEYDLITKWTKLTTS